VAHDLDRPRNLIGHEREILEQSAAPRDGPPRALSTFAAQSANALSALRFVLASAWVALYFSGHARRPALAAIAAVAAASDFIDGRLARRLAIAGGAGQWLDSVADVTFVLAALGCAAASGALPVYIPALIALAFAQYAADSLILKRAAGPIRSRLGHWGGIINYALVLVLAFAPPDSFPLVAIRAIAPAIALFYLGGIAERAIGYWRSSQGAARAGSQSSR